jgi:NTE family protein
MASKKIAIACQGGGTHAAFTWGVLTEILRAKKLWQAETGGGDGIEIIAISGTSAGALCALAAWYGLVPNSADEECGTIDKAIERLDYLWETFAAITPTETIHNQMVGNLLELRSKGVPLPYNDPYAASGQWGLTGLSLLGAREQYLQFPALLRSLCPHFAEIDWPGVAKADLRIVVGAIELLSGNFEVFDSDKTIEQLGLRPADSLKDQYSETRWRMRRSLSLEGVAASGTLPEVLPAQVIPDMTFPTCERGKTVTRDGYYWDGLYSQNPPIRDLLDVASKSDKPDEIWVVRINPQECNFETMNIGLPEIRDRENDLSGNLSLNQELDHILTVNRWIERYGTDHPPLDARKIIKVRTIKMTRDTACGLRYTTKFDRSLRHLRRLYDEGRQVTEEWLRNWRAQADDFPSYPDDARYPGDCLNPTLLASLA